MSTHFDDMDDYQRRLHNALLVMEADGYYEAEGYAPMMREVIEHISALRQQDMARLARMREALEFYANGEHFSPAHIGQECYQVNECTEFGTKASGALSETADIPAWLDGQRAEERELCAKICDEKENHLLSLAKIQTTDEDKNSYLSDCFIVRSLSEAIRARSTKGEG